MFGFLAELTGVDLVYAACAIVGGLLFLVRTILTLVGGFDQGGGDAGDVGDGSDGADASFRALSIQGITAFFMMFGLVGLALSRQSHFSVVVSVVGALGAGLLTVWIIGRMFLGMASLQSDGTLRYENAIGQEGIVYLKVPAHGSGQVNVSIQQRLRTCEAVSADKKVLNTGERVVVVDVVNGNVLVVTKAS